MMRFAQRSCVYRIIGMPSAPSCIFRRRTANDAVVTTGCALPHHWHAFHVFCIVLACICSIHPLIEGGLRPKHRRPWVF